MLLRLGKISQCKAKAGVWTTRRVFKRWGPRNQTLTHYDKAQILRHSPVKLCCWLDCILSFNYYSVLYLQSQSLAIKVLSNVWEVSRVHVYPFTVWLTGTICKRSTLPVTNIYLQLYHKCFLKLVFIYNLTHQEDFCSWLELLPKQMVMC